VSPVVDAPEVVGSVVLSASVLSMVSMDATGGSHATELASARAKPVSTRTRG
jgi:hypothetical protein